MFAQAGLTAGVSGLGNAASQVHQNKGFKNFNALDVVGSAVLGGATSFMGSVVGSKATSNISKQANNLIRKGANKIIKGQQSLLSGSRYGKGGIKVGSNLLNSGIKRLNTARGLTSVIGSGVGVIPSFMYNRKSSK